jgi:membrane-associated protease RseP (regulator of RpoE activity)
MAMTREEMQRLASYGRDGDTMLAHINPEEAALLKSRGGSGTINPNTGLPEFKWSIKNITGGAQAAVNNPVAAVKQTVVDPVVQPVQKAASQVSSNLANLPGSVQNTVNQVVSPLKSAASAITSADVKSVLSPISSILSPLKKAASQVSSNLSNLPGSVENTVKQVAANPVAQLALAYYMPTIASSLAPYMVGVPAAYQTAVASALASTAIQTAQGVPFEQALKSATVNAVTSTGAPVAAIYVEDLVGNQKVADALTSIGASAAKTAAMGGTKDDIEKNMVAALTGSGLTTALQAADVSRDVSRVAGAAAGGAVVGGTTGAISGAAGELGSQAARDAAKLEAQKGTKLAAAGDGTMTDAGRMLDTVQVVNQREPDPTLQDTSIITPNVSVAPKAKSPAPTARPPLPLVTVTGTREPDPTLQDTDITLPETTVTGTQETEPTDTSAKEAKPPVDEQGRYNPNLFIYGGVKPKSSLGSSLKTQAPFYPLAGTSGGLTSTRGAGELESKETGKKRQNVWNEESLRLKDALGI